MIYTVTFNPSIDYVVHTPAVTLGEINRATEEQMYFGGKGINVSIVLKELGLPSAALGFVAGFTGEAIEKGLADMGITADLVRLKKGCSRINVKIKSEQETDINGMGPDIDSEALKELFGKLEGLADGDTLVLAGSIPPSVPSDIYERILAMVAESGKKVRTVVDATKDLLLNVLKYRPFLVKPNDIELGEMFGVKLTTVEEIAVYAGKLRDMGAVNVLVSRAGDGALLIDEDGKLYTCGACRGVVKNSVGAGDSMVAGFLAGVIGTGDNEYALKLGTAAGGATAFSDGLAERALIDELLKTL